VTSSMGIRPVMISTVVGSAPSGAASAFNAQMKRLTAF
jgi:hypothetical protein